MKNYRKKQSIYILAACRIFNELETIQYLSNDLFEKTTPQKLSVLRTEIEKLISFIEKIPIYGKSEIKERKIKGSIYFEHKAFFLNEIQKIYPNITTAICAGKERVLKAVDVFDKIDEIKKYIYYLQVYWYDNEAEKKMSYQYSRYYKELKKRERQKAF